MVLEQTSLLAQVPSGIRLLARKLPELHVYVDGPDFTQHDRDEASACTSDKWGQILALLGPTRARVA